MYSLNIQFLQNFYNRQRSLLIFWQGFLLLTLFLNQAHSQETLSSVTLATGEWPPYASSTMENKGYLSEIVKAAFAEVGIEAKFNFFPWKRGEQMVQKGQLWATFPYGKSSQRELDFIFSDDLYSTITQFFYYKPHFTSQVLTSMAQMQNLNDLKSYKLGGILGYFYQDIFNSLDLKVEYVLSEVNNVHKLQKGRVDFAVMNDIVGWSTIAALYPQEIEQFAVISQLKMQGGNFLMISRKFPHSEQLQEKFSQGLAIIKQKGIYQNIIDRLRSKLPAVATPPATSYFEKSNQ